MKLCVHSKHKCHEHLEYEVLSYDPKTKKGMVRNLHGSRSVTFEAILEKETLVRNGWVLSNKTLKEKADG